MTELVLGRQPTAPARNVSVVLRGTEEAVARSCHSGLMDDGDWIEVTTGESHETSSLNVTKLLISHRTRNFIGVSGDELIRNTFISD